MWHTRKLATATVAFGLLLQAGCDEKSQTDLQERAADVQDKAGDMATAAADKAKEGWDSLKAEYGTQIDGLSEQVATLKEKAATFKDTQLDGYITQLDGKISDIKTKLGESFSADGLTALKENVSKWMREAQELYDKAAARLAELAQGAGTPAPAGG